MRKTLQTRFRPFAERWKSAIATPAADASPSDEELAQKAQVARHAASIAHERMRLRQRHGHPGSVQLSPTESETAVQTGKDGVVRPSYKHCNGP